MAKKTSQERIAEYLANFEGSGGSVDLPDPVVPRLGRTATPTQPTDNRGEFSKGISRGIDQTQALGYGALSLAGDMVDWEGLRQTGLEGYKRNMAEAEESPARVGRVEDWSNVGDVIDWGSGVLGELGPTLAAVALSGGTGALAAGAIKVGGKQVMKKALGAQLGLVAGATAMETGEIYGDVAEQGAEGVEAWAPALAGGALAGSLEALPILRVAKMFGLGSGGLKKEIIGSLKKRMLKEGAKQAGIEAGTEVLQTAIEEGTKAFILNKGLPEEMGSYLLNAAAAGALGGGVLGGAAGGIVGKPSIEDAAAKVRDPKNNPITKEAWGSTGVAKYGSKLAELDQKIKSDLVSPGAKENLTKEAAAILDEVELTYLQKETDKDGKAVVKKPLDTKEAQDVMDFYGPSYKGKNAIEITDVAPETDEQREARLADEQAAQRGKQELDKTTKEALDIAEEAVTKEETTEVQIQKETEETTVALEEEIKKNAQEIVGPTDRRVEDVPIDFLERRQAGDTEETIAAGKQRDLEMEMASTPKDPKAIPKFLQRQPDDVIPPAQGGGRTDEEINTDLARRRLTEDYDENTPATGVMHTLRNTEDLNDVLNTGLKPQSNVGGPNSQAIGSGGITLEYDPADVDITSKGYNANEGVVSNQRPATPKRILVDTSDLGLEEGTGGTTEADRLLAEAEELMPAGIDQDEFIGAIGGLTLVYDRAMYSPREKMEALNEFQKTYGKDVADWFRENGEDLNKAMDNPEGIEGMTEEQYIKDIQEKAGDIPVFTYQSNEDGKPTNIQPVKAPEVVKEKVTKEVVTQIEAEAEAKSERRPKVIEQAEAKEVAKLVAKDQGETLLVNAIANLISQRRNKAQIQNFIDGFSEKADLNLTGRTDELIEKAIAQMAGETAPEVKETISQEDIDFELTQRLDELPLTNLRQALKGKGVKGISKMKKPELLEAVTELFDDVDVYSYVRDAFATRDAKKKTVKQAKAKREATQKENKSKLAKLRNDKAEQEDIREATMDPIEAARQEEMQAESSARKAAERIAAMRETKEEAPKPVVQEEVAEGEIALNENQLSEEDRKKIEQIRLEEEMLADTDDYGYDDDFGPDDDDFSFRSARKTNRNLKFAKVQDLNFDSTGRFLERRDNPLFAKYNMRIKMMRQKMENSIASLSRQLPGLKFKFVTNMSDVPSYERVTMKAGTYADNGITNPGQLSWRGLFVPDGQGGATIYMNPHHAEFIYTKDGVAEFQKDFLHELVGHYGMRRLFEALYADNSKWDYFKQKIIDDSPDIWKEALALRHRWQDIDMFKGKNKVHYAAKNLKGEDMTLLVGDDARMRLMEEWIAEKAKEFFDPEVRNKWTKETKGIMKRIITWIRHKLRRLLNETPIQEEEIMAMLAQSYDNLFGKGVWTAKPSLLEGSKQDLVDGIRKGGKQQVFYSESAESYNEAVDNGAVPPRTEEEAVSERQEGLRQAARDGISVEDILATESASQQGYGKIRQNAVTKLGTKYWQAFRDKAPTLYTLFNARGTLRNYDMKNAQAMNALGKMGADADMGKEALSVLKDLTLAQSQAVMEYFKDAEGDANNINLPDADRRKLMAYKQRIMEFGEKLVELGYLDPDTYYKNMGSYLPIQYLAYASQATGSGRKASPMAYLLKRQNLGETEKNLLGEFNDPAKTIPGILAMMGRDVALAEYTQTIVDLSRESDLGWLLTNRTIERWNDGKEIGVEKAEDMIENWKAQLKDFEAGNRRFGKNEAKVAQIQEAIDYTQEQVNTFKAELAARIRDVSGVPLDQPIPEREFTNAVGESYKKMPDERGYGALRGQWVRKEIYDEFVESSLISEDMGSIAEALGPGGKIDRANQLWKSMKVPFNVPSWFRNGIGNLVLLDIATPTNIGKLTKMVMEEFKLARKGDPSTYWQEAHKRGLFGTTFSSNEIFLLSKEANVLRDAQMQRDIDNATTGLKSVWFKSLATWWKVSEVMAEKYGQLEGVFKTVAMRDHIERWKEQNGIASLDDLTAPQREAVINQSVVAANQAIFDYSELTAWQKDLRRSAFGAPFITYTMKAAPATVRGLSRNPQKFAKYVALPYILSGIALSGLGDLSPEELDEWEKNQPKWMKEKSSVYVLPYKDSNGKLLPMDFGYWFPWAPWQDMAMKTMSNFQGKETPTEIGLATAQSAWEGVNGMGLLGGPIPTTLAAVLTNKETFLGRDIVSPGDSAGTSLAKIMSWSYTLMAPPWLTDQGVAGKLMDHADLSITGLPNKNVDAFGGQKASMTSTLLRGVGVSTYPTTIEEATINRNKDFNRQIMELKRSRSKAAKNLGWPQERRIREIGDINRRLILLQKKIQNDNR